MPPDAAMPKLDLTGLVHGGVFDAIYGHAMSSVMLVDVTEKGEGFPKILRVNPAFTMNTGFTAEEAIGRSTNFMLGEETNWDTIAKFRNAARQVKPARGELAIHTKSGAVKWVESVTTPFELDGRIICLLVHRDISERKRTEEELERQTELLKRAEMLGRIGHWIWNLETDHVFWSDEMYRIHGLSHTDESRRGAPISYCHDDDRADFKRFLGEAKRDGKDFEFVLRVVVPDGRIRYVDTKGYCRRGADGTVTEIFGVFQDVTDVYEITNALDAERDRLIDAIDSISGGVLVLDSDDRIVMANRHYLEALPELAGIAIPGARFENVVRRIGEIRLEQRVIDDVDAFVTMRMAHHARGEGIEAFQLSDGRWFEIEEHPMRDGGRMLIRNEVTEHMNAQQALMRAKEEAEFASHSKSEFLANMSHELRTPLNAIIGFGEMMKLNISGEMPEPYRQYAADIVDSGEHLLRIINDILDLSKIEGGMILLDRTYEDVDDLIESTVPLVRQAAMANDTKVEISTTSRLPRLYCDGLRIKQVLLNLLSNGVKFAPNGTVTVSAEARGGWLHIDVVDTGIGMHADDIELAMTPFGQIEKSHLARQFQGTGLGLPLARNLTELHGGHFRIDSRPGQGTGVHLTFPLGVTDQINSGEAADG